MSDLVAGIDVATREARVVVANARGQIVSSGALELAPVRRPAAGHSEQDAASWWPAVAGALRQAIAPIGAATRRIAAVTVTATSGTVVLVDRNGRPAGPALLYDDRRAVAQAQRAQALGRERWEACALRIGASFALAKLAWLAETGALARADGAWGPADVVVARLTGAPPATDWSHALKTGWDAVREEWPADVLDGLGISKRLLPPVMAPGALAGCVGAVAAAETGLPRGCEVRLGMTDGCTAQIACGAVQPGRFVGTLGTTLVVKGASAAPVRDPTGAIYNHRLASGAWLPGGASNTGGEALRARFPQGDLRALDAAAARHGPAAAVMYPLVGVGERFPFVDAQATGFVLGEPAGDVETYRAALEGVAFVERLAYERLAALGAAPEGAVAAAGRASASAVWNRIRATVLERPLVVPAHPASAFGAAMLAASATIHDGLAATVAAMVHHRAEVEPDPREAGALEAGYARLVAELRARGWLEPAPASMQMATTNED
jgi:sugar (pentulose or hexulose) kinase